MELTLTDRGKIEIDLCDLIESLPMDKKEQIILHLACAADVIRAVTDQIVEGMTFDRNRKAWWGYRVDGAQRRVVKAASELYKQEIERLERDLARERQSANEWVQKYHALLHKGER